MKILVPVSHKEDIKLTAGFVANMTWPPNSQVKIVNVLPAAGSDQQADKHATAAKKMLGDALAQFAELLPGPKLTTEVLSGTPAVEILNYARTWKANMIVMGHRSQKSIAEAIAGSVSKAVAVEAPCSVVIIRPPEIVDRLSASAPESERKV